MKAIIKATDQAGSLQVTDMPAPQPGPGEVLVQIKATGLCYSDVTILNNKYVGRKPVPIPLILGHEGAGLISELGRGVNAHSAGDRVVIEPLAGCGHCNQCLKGFKNMCQDWEHVGITRHGTFSEYIVVPVAQVHRIPDNVTFEEAALTEPFGLVVRSLEQSKPMAGETVAILGPGSLGIMHLLAYKASGASKVIMVGLGKDRKRFDIARTLGADHTINIEEKDPVKAILDITDGEGVDIVVETANSPKATQLTFDLVAPRGRIVLFGLYPKAEFSPVAMLRKGLSVYGDVAQVTRQFLYALKLLASDKINLLSLITRRFSFDEAPEAFEVARQGDMVKVIFKS
ncbi:MAG TPA: hypothetical protein ENI06_10785 [Spirochaetales bacterium]|nr:hypothetical protein [Spirochaetales bacterium]